MDGHELSKAEKKETVFIILNWVSHLEEDMRKMDPLQDYGHIM